MTMQTEVNPAASLSSWIEVLRLRAAGEKPGRSAYLFLDDGERERDEMQQYGTPGEEH